MEAIQLTPKSTAALLRSILRRAFPRTKFSITTGRGSMVSSVRVSWTDGPTPARVEEITNRLKAGAADSMTDGYAYATGTDRFLVVDEQTYRTGCRHVFTSRTISPAFAQKLAECVAAFYGVATPAVVLNKWGSWQVEDAPRLDGEDFGTHIYRASLDRTRYLPTDARTL